MCLLHFVVMTKTVPVIDFEHRQTETLIPGSGETVRCDVIVESKACCIGTERTLSEHTRLAIKAMNAASNPDGQVPNLSGSKFAACVYTLACTEGCTPVCFGAQICYLEKAKVTFPCERTKFIMRPETSMAASVHERWPHVSQHINTTSSHLSMYRHGNVTLVKVHITYMHFDWLSNCCQMCIYWNKCMIIWIIGSFVDIYIYNYIQYPCMYTCLHTHTQFPHTHTHTHICVCIHANIQAGVCIAQIQERSLSIDVCPWFAW
jgi:hypothetical protein